MGIKEDVTVTQYDVGKIIFTGKNAETLRGFAIVELYNTNDQSLGSKKVELSLSAGEKAAIISNVQNRMQTLEANTGWTRYTG